ncbi:MAG: hypothetical protein ACR5LD_04820 [Symbiopectobacterium sp.]
MVEEISLLSPRVLHQHLQRISIIFKHFNLLHARNVQNNIAVPL